VSPAGVGQGLRNVFSAREFVWWYNGHPDYRDLPVDLSKVGRHLSLRVPRHLPRGRTILSHVLVVLDTPLLLTSLWCWKPPAASPRRIASPPGRLWHSA